jgi:signal transduction histidine kinase/ligand-binding sensor domain-containing protein
MIKLFSFILILFINYSSVFSQTGATFKRWSVNDGLSHNYVREILQDREGFIWVATEDGLNQFNGYTFQIYLQSHVINKVSVSHAIMALEEDKYGNIWVGTWGGGIYIYDKKQSRFQKLSSADTANGLSLSSDFIYDLYSDSEDNMWVGTADNGVDKLNIDTWSSVHYGEIQDGLYGLTSNRAISITEDQKKNIWIATLGGGLNCLDPRTGKVTKYRHVPGNAQSLADDKVYCIVNDKQNRLWIGTWDHGLDVFDPETKTFTHFRHRSGQKGGLPNDQVWTLALRQNGAVWVGTDDGLAVYSESSHRFSVYKNDPFDTKSLSANTIKCVYSDRQDRMWVGTYNSGINLYDKYLTQLGHYYKRSNSNVLMHNEISAFVEDDEGNILIGSDGGGLTIYQYIPRTATRVSTESELRKIAYLEHQPGNPKSLASNKVKTILKDRRKRIWIGYWAGGLDCFDRQTNRITHYSLPPAQDSPTSLATVREKKYLRSNNVVCLAEDKDGLIWIGTFGGGLHSLNPDTGEFTFYDVSVVNDIHIWSLLVDSHNRIWVGTSSGYWQAFVKKNQSLQRLVRKQESHAIFDIKEDTKGRIWIATEGGGLLCLNQRLEPVTGFTQQDGLPSNGIQAIEFDKQGNVWISTNRGLARIQPDSRSVRVFDIMDGIQGLQFNRQSSARLRSGALLFGGNNGFNLFHPDSLHTYQYTFPLMFLDLELFNKKIPIAEHSSPLQTHINYQKSVQLSYKESVISISFAALDYTAPQKLKYIYRLKGFVDDTWQQADESRKVTYTNLAPGNYTFEVSYLLYGIPSTQIRSLSIQVVPPVWQTWWARLLIIVSISVTLVGIYFIRVRSIRLANSRLEQQVIARTADLQRINALLLEKSQLIQEQKEEIETQAEELTESNNTIRSINATLEEQVDRRTRDLKKTNQELDNFVYRVSHDIRAPLSSLSGLVTLMNEEMDPDQLQMYRDMAMKSIRKLDGFVKDILDYSRNSRVAVRTELIDLSELIETVWKDLEYIKNASRVKLILQATELHPYYGDLTRLQIVFQNILSNAIKYQNLQQEHPYLQVTIRVEPAQAVVELEDNGIGIEESRIDRVFDMFYRASELSTGSGIGLYIVKEAIEKLNGTIELHSIYGQGTTFRITLPNQQPS